MRSARQHVARARRLATRVRRRATRPRVEPSTKSLIEDIDSITERGDVRALRRLLERSPELAPRDQERVYRRFYRSFLDLGEQEQAEVALTRAAGPHNRTAATVFASIEREQFDQVRHEFQRNVSLFTDERSHDDWHACFDALYDPRGEPAITEGDRPLGTELPVHFQRTIGTGWRFVSVSGMGWSGSGAVYDALRSHRGTRSVAGESRMLEGKYGLSALPVDAADGDGFRRAVQLLFRYCLLGYAPCRTWEDYRHVRNARRASMGPRGHDLARASRVAVHSLLSSSPENRAALVSELSPRLLEASTFAQLGDATNVPVLDNLVHVANLGLASTYPDVLFLAVVRDPRDQFLDIVRNNPRASGNVARFAKRYKHTRSILDQRVAAGEGSIRVVSFERFVSDESARDEAVGDIVADLGTLRKRPRFDPEVSRQNIGLWRDTEHRNAVRWIEATLPEFLVN